MPIIVVKAIQMFQSIYFRFSVRMLRDLPVVKWLLEYKRMAHVEHHETCAGLSFARVLFEFARDGTVLPCNTLFKRSLHRYKRK